MVKGGKEDLSLLGISWGGKFRELGSGRKMSVIDVDRFKGLVGLPLSCGKYSHTQLLVILPD